MTNEIDQSGIVYIVDDDPTMRKTLQLLVKKSIGCEVECFECYEDLIESISTGRPSVLILDYQLPSMTGLEVQRKLVESGLQIPIILLSGFANVEIAVEAMENGAIAVLEKPFNCAKLVDRLKKAFSSSADFLKKQHFESQAKEVISRLSGSELQVLKEMIKGQLNKQIASKLNVSLRTVERRKNQIFQKTESYSLPELADFVKRSGA